MTRILSIPVLATIKWFDDGQSGFTFSISTCRPVLWPIAARAPNLTNREQEQRTVVGLGHGAGVQQGHSRLRQGIFRGVGLLLLRVAVAVIAVIQGGAYFAGAGPATVLVSIVGALTVLSGASLVFGFLTPLASTLVGILVAGTGVLWIPPPSINLFETPLPTLLTSIIAVSILGPGALSVDARLFGRREIIIPRLPPTS